ncbi:caspase family protein [Clostridium niameyense]|nr:caspase family protein [Clostridium niameyense]
MNSKKGLALIIANAIYDEQNNIQSCTKDGIDMIEKFNSMKFDIIDGINLSRNNPFHTKGLNTLGLAELNVGSGTFVSFATAPNSTSGGYGSAEYNSIFTKFLLNHIDKPNLKIEDMFKLVRNDVENYTSKEQIPWESTSLKTDFCFNTMSDNEIDETIYKLITNFDTVNSLLLLSDYLQLPISNIMRKYKQYKSNLPGGIYFSNQLEFEEFILKNILDLGFKIKNYR